MIDLIFSNHILNDWFDHTPQVFIIGVRIDMVRWTILDQVAAQRQRIGLIESKDIISEDIISLPHADIGVVPTLLLLVLDHIQISMVVEVLADLFNRNAETDEAIF